ncbi:MAG TPA: prephenate dehydrogenase [Mycobacteriales bacterium]|nr:prephenate dehydrogenase [Mycobacteriales bacterium]
MSRPPSVLVVGTGLIGTSLGLALRDAADVVLADTDTGHAQAAVARGAGSLWDGNSRVDLAVACVPPARTAGVIQRLLVDNIAHMLSHVASIQARVQAEVETLAPPEALHRVCGGHPMAGRELRGPGAASAQLFLDRPWAVCASAHSSADSVDAVRWLAEATGAVPLEMAPDDHDSAVALVSHAPQAVASALAARLLDAPDDGRALALAGPGVQDATRIAAGDAALWVDVLRGNASRVAPLLRDVAQDLLAAAASLDDLVRDPEDERAAAVLSDLLRRGAGGRARLPLKQRARDRVLASVVVSLPDRPGRLAAVLAAAARSDVNVEDVRVEHLPGRPRGLLELVVDGEQVDAARRALAGAGFDVLEG